jgi:DMSO/TMAO reductase YedYZ molybdopterin-dependent catalytic subunit
MLQNISRREFAIAGGVAFSAAALLRSSGTARAFPSWPDEVVVPWLDQPDPNPFPDALKSLLKWEELDSWITPNDEFFSIQHFPDVQVDPSTWRLSVDGLVASPMSLSLEEIKARPRQEVVFTIECSGNHGFPFNIGAIGNAQWAGTPLAAVLEEAGVADDAMEVVFWGADSGDVELHDNIRDVVMHQNFARSMSLADAMNPNNILCYEMNGTDLPDRNGAPLRLIAPGWYGVANVKWLTRIELRDRRFMNLFMGRNYVTIREEVREGETVWVETSVGPSRLKSAPARVVRSGDQYGVIGAAWGAPIARVEVKIDDGPWQEATIDRGEDAEFAWKIWSLDWPDAAPGEHTVTSRAISESGEVQPAMDDPWIAGKHTYWESNGQITRRVALT